MAQKLKNLNRAVSRAVIPKDRRELMAESLGRAEEIRQSLKGRKHSDSTTLIAEDRKQ
jgi:hypothetical protein